ncbi:MAG: RNA methyltransferase [Cyanobacteria bacterium RI_101]|nr:RNA methyltransferase [Cyanobacteria bacterium RI_101]
MKEFPNAVLTSRQNPLIKRLRKLQQSKGRREQGCLLLEGTHLLEAALAHLDRLEWVGATDAWQQKYPQLWRRALNQSQDSAEVSPEVLAALTTTPSPDGVAAVIADSTPNLTPPPTPSLALLLDRLQDPGNLGTILRVGAAAGLPGLWLTPDCVDLGNPKVLRASAGAWFQTPRQILNDPISWVQSLSAQGYQIIAAAPRAPKLYWDLDFSRPTLLLLGSEGQGLRPELAALANEAAAIPQAPGVESLNAAVSAALILYEARRQGGGSIFSLKGQS